MIEKKYIYTFNYDANESDICKLESKAIFSKEEKKKQLFSNIEVNPSSSAFIKKRVDILSKSDNYEILIEQIRNLKIQKEGFKVEYLVLDGDETEYGDRLSKLKDIGYSIEGFPDYINPTRTYAISYYEGIWYFGVLHKNNFTWHKHRKKPHSYSNSITLSIAKALVNIASTAKKEKKILDACCGVGTILLEGCFAGYDIDGCDINEKVCKSAEENLAHFDYQANIFCSDIKDISGHYDAAIIDLPYNLFSNGGDPVMQHIIESSTQISNRLVIVSTTDISKMIDQTGFKIESHCTVKKRKKMNFERRIWLCIKN